MNFEPFISAGWVIQLHTIFAIVAFVLGGTIFLKRKGSKTHRSMGKLWVLLMLIVALSSFFISELRVWGAYSPIHLISVFTIISLVLAIRAVRVGRIDAHQNTMRGIYLGGLVVAGALSFLPGRMLHRMFFAENITTPFTKTENIWITLAGALVVLIYVAWRTQMSPNKKHAELK